MFKLSKFMDEGTTNPIVARLGPGMTQLVPFTTLAKEQQEALSSCCIETMQLVLLADKTARRVLEEFNAVEQKILNSGIVVQRQVIEMPSASNLHEVGSFLVQSKKALQSAIRVFDIVFSQKFKNAGFHKALDWAKPNLGESHPLTHLLSDDGKWITHLINLRNEEEHPSPGKPLVSNYDVNRRPDGKWDITPPKFLFDGTDVKSCLDSYSYNLLTFIEELFVLSIQAKLPAIIGIAEVPENQRNPSCPARFVVVPLVPLPREGG